jgi:hypothetical protein
LNTHGPTPKVLIFIFPGAPTRAPDKMNWALLCHFVGRKKDVSADDLNEWHIEFERLSEAGRYFFSTNRYIFRASIG